MRVKDSKIYIFLVAVSLCLSCVFAFVYFSMYNNNVKRTYQDEAILSAKSSLVELDEAIARAQISFDMNDNLITPVDTFSDKELFNDDNYCILRATVAEGTNDDGYYLYLLSTDESRIGRLPVSYLFPSDDNSLNSAFFDPSDGSLAYSSNMSIPFYSFLSTNADIEDLRAEINKGNSYSMIIKIEKKSCTVACIKITDNLYYGQVDLANEYQTFVTRFSVLTGVLIVMICLSLILGSQILILNYRKHNKLILATRQAAIRQNSILIRCKSNGKIINIHHRIKELLKLDKKLNNVNDFVATNDKSMTSCLAEDSYITAMLLIEGKPLYIEFMIFRFNFTYYLIGRNVSYDHQNRIELEQMVLKNPHTNLPNYNKLIFDYPEFLAESVEHYPAAMMISITNYNEVSKGLGAKAYNKLLADITKRLHLATRLSYVYSIDEKSFVVLFSANNSMDIMNKATSIHNSAAKPYRTGNNDTIVKTKTAVIDLSLEGANLEFSEFYEKLLATNDKALTTLNTDIVRYDESIRNMALRRKEMLDDLQIAIDNREFILYYQPQLDLQANRIVGFEALVRWNNPKYIKSSPQEFIELAEQNGYIVAIGKLIIDEACKTAKEFSQYDVKVSINVSPAQLLQAGFTTYLLESFNQNQLLKGSVAIEITETFLMENFNLVVEKLSLIRDNGFAIHLDDFGTGYSSLQYLKELPIDVIKTDREFIKNIESDNYSQVIIKTICSMANALDLRVISEGVETVEQASILKKLGSDCIQGYLISKPIDKEAALELIKSNYKLGAKPGRKS